MPCSTTLKQAGGQIARIKIEATTGHLTWRDVKDKKWTPFPLLRHRLVHVQTRTDRVEKRYCFFEAGEAGGHAALEGEKGAGDDAAAGVEEEAAASAHDSFDKMGAGLANWPAAKA